jgi:hypothetical protein
VYAAKERLVNGDGGGGTTCEHPVEHHWRIVMAACVGGHNVLGIRGLRLTMRSCAAARDFPEARFRFDLQVPIN